MRGIAAACCAALITAWAHADQDTGFPAAEAGETPIETPAQPPAAPDEPAATGTEEEGEEGSPALPEGFRFGPDPVQPPPAAEPPPRFGPGEEPGRPDTDAEFPCDRLEYLWSGPYAGEPGAENDPDRPASLMDAAEIYAEYLRYLFLSGENTAPCEVAHDPLVTLANACAGVARGRDSAQNLAALIASDPAVVQAVWVLDAVVRYDNAHGQAWTVFFGPGPAVRIIGMMFDELPRGGAPVYQALLRLTETSQGVYADYIARRFIDLFANRPQWVLLNAERLIPFGPMLRATFCTYLSIPEREALVLRYGEFPYSDTQAAIIELIACL